MLPVVTVFSWPVPLDSAKGVMDSPTALAPWFTVKRQLPVEAIRNGFCPTSRKVGAEPPPDGVCPACLTVCKRPVFASTENGVMAPLPSPEGE